MFNIIPLILIMISLAVIIVIVVRKFSVLASLDIETIQKEREVKMKEQIIGTKIKRNFYRYFAKFSRLVVPAGHGVAGFFRWLYQKLINYRENYQAEQRAESGEQQIIEQMTAEAAEFEKEERYDEAEKKYIEIIGIEPKNTDIFISLGRLYFIRKDFNEAKQTFEHAIKQLQNEYDKNQSNRAGLTEEQAAKFDEIPVKIAEVYFDLASANKAMELYSEAQEAAAKALKLAQNNPRYLDIMLEISIINKDKIAALDAYEKMAQVNPENQKLAAFKAEVDKL